MDKLVWVSVQNGWTDQTTIIDGVVILIAIANWSRTNLNECNQNSKAFHALFLAVSPEEFRCVFEVQEYKRSWDILEITYEGTKTVKNSKLQILTNRFEEIMIKMMILLMISMLN